MEKPPRYPQWTEDKVDLLEFLWRAGVETKEIRKQLGGEFSRAAIQGKVLRLQLPRRGTATVKRPPNKAVAQPCQEAVSRPETPVDHKIEAVRRFSFEDATPSVITFDRPWDEERHACKWPLDDPAHADFAYCGKPTGRGVYCSSHKRVAFLQKRSIDENLLYEQIMELERSGRKHAA